MRIAILGNSGSGKSTLARRLAKLHGLSYLDLDTVAWEPGKVAVPRDPAAAVADVRAFCTTHEKWVVEGCYEALVEATLVLAPRLIFLDPGLEACLANCSARPWEPHKYVSPKEQDEKLAFLLSWVRAYYVREGDLSRVAHLALFEAYQGVKQRISTQVDSMTNLEFEFSN